MIYFPGNFACGRVVSARREDVRAVTGTGREVSRVGSWEWRGFTRREYVVCTVLYHLMDEDGMGLCVFRPFGEGFEADTEGRKSEMRLQGINRGTKISKYVPIAIKHSAA
jgi:hypothetical protein